MTRMDLAGSRDKKKIIHICGFPPPFGGVTIFLQRLKYYTDISKDRRIYYVDISRCNVEEKTKKGIICINRSQTFSFLLREKPAHIIFHSNSVFHLLLNVLFMHRHRFIYFTHGESILKAKNKRGWRHRVLSKAEYIVCPTDHIYSEVKSTFPNTNVKEISFVLYPEELQPLHEPKLDALREKVDFVFSSYASSLSDHEGASIYGVDMLIEALYRLRKDGYNCGMVFLISNISDQRKFQDYMERVRELGLKDHFVVLDQPIDEASRLYKDTDAYLRATNMDANAFSVYEALKAGTPVLASDAAPRPEGCLTFENRNVDHLVEKMKFLIDHYDDIKRSVKNLNMTGNERELLDFFRGIEQ